MNAQLVPVEDRELDDFVAFFDDYRRELDVYHSSAPDVLPIQRYRDALHRDPGGQELLWIEVDGVRAGFLFLRAFEDWPDATRIVVDIAECYVVPQLRRRGVGQAAIEALLARERARETSLVEASVLRGNEAALAFWQSLGFTPHSIRTARQP